jgi:hypothetical protein
MFRARHSAREVEFSAAPQKLGLVWAWIAIHPRAQVTRDEGERHTWLKMAASWVPRAKLSVREVERSSKTAAE